MHVVIKYISIRCPAQTKSQVKSSCALWVVRRTSIQKHRRGEPGNWSPGHTKTHKYLSPNTGEVRTSSRDTRTGHTGTDTDQTGYTPEKNRCGMVLSLDSCEPLFSHEKLGRRTSYMCTERRRWEIHVRKSSTSQAVDCLARTMCDDLAFREKKTGSHIL